MNKRLILKWGKAKYSITIVDLNKNDIQTEIFANRKDLDDFIKSIEPEYYDYCEGGPSICDQIDNMDGQDNGGSVQMCYSEDYKKYYIISYISMW